MPVHKHAAGRRLWHRPRRKPYQLLILVPLLVGSTFVVLLPPAARADDTAEDLKLLRAEIQKELSTLKKREQQRAAGLLVPLPVLVLVLVSDLVLLLLLVSEFPLIFVASLPFCAAGLLVPPEVLVFL